MKIKIPEDMDVPETRRDTDKIENVRWLFRNLFIRNKNHPEFHKIINELGQVLQDKQMTKIIKTRFAVCCWKCPEKIVQLDMIDNKYSYIIGCKLLTKKQWEKGLKDNKQTKCPKNSKKNT